MAHRFYKFCNLAVMEQNGYASLFKVYPIFTPEGYKIEPVDFLSLKQLAIDLYEQEKLIFTAEAVYSLDGRMLAEKSALHRVHVIKMNNVWGIYLATDSAIAEKLLIWDGQQIIQRYQGKKIVFNSHFTAVAETPDNSSLTATTDHLWKIYRDGVLLPEYTPVCHSVAFYGNILLAKSTAVEAYCYDTRELLCRDMEEILCSANGDFLLCRDKQGFYTSLYNKHWCKLGKFDEQADILDKAKLFCLKHGENIRIFKFDGEVLFADVRQYSYAEDESSLIFQIGEKMIFIPC